MTSLAQSIIYDDAENSLRILNQLLLPITVEYENVHNVEDGWNVIRQMKVRGAPAIAMVGLLSLAVEIGLPETQQSFLGDPKRLLQFIKEKGDYLCTARPTAVNIRKEFDTLLQHTTERYEADHSQELSQLIDFVRAHCHHSLITDQETNRKIGNFGAEHILQHSIKSGHGRKVTVLTHCNTGSLATAGYGTALGVIRSLHRSNYLEHAYCTETRPYNQGARLTAFELYTEQIPSTLICDDMVAHLMATRHISAVVVGADRVVANGDTANKIGTHQIAILCKHFGVPFYVASPLSTLDLSIPDGSSIPIEERPPNEMRFVGDTQIAPAAMNCWNPSFDVTPAALITGGVITELGVVRPEDFC